MLLENKLQIKGNNFERLTNYIWSNSILPPSIFFVTARRIYTYYTNDYKLELDSTSCPTFLKKIHFLWFWFVSTYLLFFDHPAPLSYESFTELKNPTNTGLKNKIATKRTTIYYYANYHPSTKGKHRSFGAFEGTITSNRVWVNKDCKYIPFLFITLCRGPFANNPRIGWDGL